VGLSAIGYAMAGLTGISCRSHAFVGQDEAVNCSRYIGAMAFVAVSMQSRYIAYCSVAEGMAAGAGNIGHGALGCVFSTVLVGQCVVAIGTGEAGLDRIVAGVGVNYLPYIGIGRCMAGVARDSAVVAGG